MTQLDQHLQKRIEAEKLTAHTYFDVYSQDKRPPQGGLYLHLFHGRNSPEEELEDWGEDGPYIGPLKSVHVTYLSTLHVEFEAGFTSLCHGEGDPLFFHQDLLYFKGKYYGDWTVQFLAPEEVTK